MDPKLDSANKRYGMPEPERRTYQACSSGLVAESRKYGSPMVAASSARIRRVGSPTSDGFQCGEGRMGSSAALAASSATCTPIWVFSFRKRIEKCAYA